MSKHARGPADTLQIELRVVDETVSIAMPVKAGPQSPDMLLPLAQELANRVVDGASRRSEAAGRPISCSKGCGACCAQLVPISAVEARALWQMIRSWPRERRQAVLQRFSDARERLQESGLWEALQQADDETDESREELALRYFEQRISCPFLEEGACSIHPVRPVACREYLVTSDPGNCSDPGAGEIDGVPIPLNVSLMMNRVLDDEEHDGADCVPLITVPDWAGRQVGRPRKRSAQEWVAAFFAPLAAETD